MCEELRTAQSRNSSLQATLDNAQKDSSALSGQRMGEQCFNGYQMLRHRTYFGVLISKKINVGPVAVSNIKYGISSKCLYFESGLSPNRVSGAYWEFGGGNQRALYSGGCPHRPAGGDTGREKPACTASGLH